VAKQTDGFSGLENGHAGASARAEYERRHARDQARRRARFGRLAPVVSVLIGPKAATEAWARGAEGEEFVGHQIDDAVGTHGVALHDRRLPPSRGNLDHLVVVASGVWVIDTKHYHGRLARRQVGGWFTSREVLTVGRRDQSRLVAGARRQHAAVEEAVGPGVPVRAALCFTGVELSLLARPFVMDRVLVTWPRALARSLRASGPLSSADCSAVADRLAVAFPPYCPSTRQAPGGTSHKPTDAPPRG
jgi:hypothetical protein